MPPASDATEVVLHVGTGKTGTTSVQGFLRHNQGLLAERGILYPRTPGRTRHLKLGLSFRSDDEYDAMPAWHQMRAHTPERFRRRFHRRFLDELAQARPRQVVLSDEAIYTLPEAALHRLRDFLAEHVGPVHVIVYLRRQDDHLVSYYQQQVKVGETRRLAEFADDPGYPYDYEQRLAELQAALRPARMTVRRFERGRFADGRLEADFLRAAGIDGDGFASGHRRNESLDAASVEFLRLYNHDLVEHGGATVGVMDHRELVVQLERRPPGPQLTLPEVELDDFMHRWERTNRAVAEAWFDENELFTEPRRRRDVTEVQEVAAADLEELMALAGLAEDVRVRLRRSREQASG